ncbi:MAG: AAA family ATPase [Gammaproteobacteria bacterium]|nr:AAA family ATPase [Gammaproteobacteria bacterium]
MIQDLKISNFKCFHDVHLRDLGRFNVIVGRNGGGKTAFLEALFLLASVGPELVLKIRRMRGLGDSVSIGAERGSFESLWRDLFFDFDQTSTITLRSVGTDENTRSLTVSYGPPAGATLPFGNGAVEEHVRHATIDFEYGLANGNAVKCQSALTSQGVSFGAVVETFPAILLSPVVREGPEHNGQRFSSLSKKGEHTAVVSAIRKQFPFIEELSVEYHGGTAMVHAKLPAVQEKVPLPLVSDGVNKVLSILLAVHHFSRGIILIDEMENGLYFDLMGRASATILDAARESNTQLFATIHSLEYLRALLPVVREHPQEFRLLRTTKDNGASTVDCFDGRHFAAALEEGLEIR